MVTIYINENNVKVVRAKGTNKHIKVSDALNISLANTQIPLSEAISQGLDDADINDTECTFVLDNNSAFLKVILIEREQLADITDIVVKHMDSLLITSKEYVIDYCVTGEVESSGKKMLSVLVACVSIPTALWYQDLAFSLGLEPVKLTVSTYSISKLLPIVNKSTIKSQHIFMNPQDDYIGLSLYQGQTIMLNRFVPMRNFTGALADVDSDVFSNISLLKQFATRVAPNLPVKDLFYFSGKYNTSNIVNNVMTKLALTPKKLEKPNEILAPDGFVFKDYTNLLGTFSNKKEEEIHDINIFSAMLRKREVEKFHIDLDFTMRKDTISRFMEKLNEIVTTSEGDVEKLKIYKNMN